MKRTHVACSHGLTRRQAVVRIQAVFRGYHVRKTLNEVKSQFEALVRSIEGADYEVVYPSSKSKLPSKEPPAVRLKQQQCASESEKTVVPLAPVEVLDDRPCDAPAASSPKQPEEVNISGSSDEADYYRRRVEMLTYLDSPGRSPTAHFAPDSLLGSSPIAYRSYLDTNTAERDLDSLLRAPVDPSNLSSSEMRKLELEMELLIAKEALRVRQQFLQQLHGASP